ncbi:MAG: S8 family serine peptidase [Anaerolineae bacterium]|nr:S8 family serine peptidase [Anaerolineae bacterium]
MKRIYSLFVVLLLAVVGSVSIVTAQQAAQPYVILMRGNSVPSSITQDIQNAGGQVMHVIPQVGIVTATSSNPDFVALLSGVRNVQEVGIMPMESLPNVTAEVNAPEAVDDLYNAGLVWGVQRVHAPEAWDAGYTGSHNTVVAVIDTGIAWNHPDLAENVVFTECFASTTPCNPYPSLSDHGTHVAGTVAASFGGGRVVGVGPNLGLAGYNVFENIPGCGVCAYSSSRWMAMLDAASRGFDVINMSLGGVAQFGGRGTNELATFIAADNRIANAVISMGTTIVASAGNENLNLNGTLVHIPSDLPGILSVGATGIQPIPRYPSEGSFDIRAFYSNYGAAVDIVAPGGDCGEISSCTGAPPSGYFYAEYLVLSSTVTLNPTCAATASCAVGYGWKGGTSMASPHVAGVAGLVADANPGLRPNQIVSLLRRTAENLGDRQQFGHGMVDAAAALGVDN